MKYIEMKTKDIRPLKEKIWIMNRKKCPVLNKEVPLNKMALDHAHKRNDEEYSENKGVIREALDFRVNAVLGKLENSLKRTGLSYADDFDIGEFLRNAADYFDRGAYIDEDGYYFIHPSETKKEPKLSKRNYNRLKKLYNMEDFVPKRKNQKKKPFPDYPRSGKITKSLKELYGRLEIEPYN